MPLHVLFSQLGLDEALYSTKVASTAAAGTFPYAEDL